MASAVVTYTIWITVTITEGRKFYIKQQKREQYSLVFLNIICVNYLASLQTSLSNQSRSIEKVENIERIETTCKSSILTHSS